MKNKHNVKLCPVVFNVANLLVISSCWQRYVQRQNYNNNTAWYNSFNVYFTYFEHVFRGWGVIIKSVQ